MQKNRIELAGYLGGKPSVRYLPSGTPVANVRISPLPAPVKAPGLKFTGRIGSRSRTEGQWPSYEESLARAGPNQEGTGPDRSTADFWWCYFALKNKFSKGETEAKLLEVSERARERKRDGDKGYVHVTVENAAERLAYNRQRSRA